MKRNKLFYWLLVFIIFFSSCSIFNRSAIRMRSMSYTIIIQKQFLYYDSIKVNNLKSIINNKKMSPDSMHFYRCDSRNKMCFYKKDVKFDNVFFNSPDEANNCSNCSNIKNWFKCWVKNYPDIGSDSVFIFNSTSDVITSINYNGKEYKVFYNIKALKESMKKCAQKTKYRAKMLVVFYFNNALNSCDNSKMTELKNKISSNQSYYIPGIDTAMPPQRPGSDKPAITFVHKSRNCNNNPNDVYLFEWKRIPDFDNYEFIIKKHDDASSPGIIYNIKVDTNNSDFCKGFLNIKKDSILFGLSHFGLQDSVCNKYKSNTPCDANRIFRPTWDIEVRGYFICCDTYLYGPSCIIKNVRLECVMGEK